MRATAVEGVPGLVVGRTHRCENSHAGLDRRREAAKKPTPKALGPPEPVDDQEINTVGDRGHERGLGVDKATFVEAAADRAGPAIFPNVESSAGPQIGNMDRGRTLPLIA